MAQIPTPRSNRTTTRPWNDPALRALAAQLLVIGLVLWFGYTLVQNTLTNMQTRGISTGFDFLNVSAGFGIIMSLVEYNETMTYGRTFVVGLLNTLLVSSMGIVLATLLGFILGVARLSSNWLVSRVALVYIETFRNIPLLLQIFFWYFAVLRNLPAPRQSIELGSAAFLSNRGLSLPAPIFNEGSGLVIAAFFVALATGIGLRFWARKRQRQTGQQFPVLLVTLGLVLVLPLLAYWLAGAPIGWDLPELRGFNFRGGVTILPELGALLLALTLYTASFIAELVRSGITSVTKGQQEAAAALGLNPRMTLKLVVIPQALRVIIPPLTSQYLNLIKNSSLATAIGYPDLVNVFMGTTLNQTGQAVEVVAITMAVYLCISLTISLLMNIYNRLIVFKER